MSDVNDLDTDIVPAGNTPELDEFLLQTGSRLLEFLRKYHGTDKREAASIASAVIEAIVASEDDLGSARLSEFKQLREAAREVTS